jgi:hypothetical protein
VIRGIPALSNRLAFGRVTADTYVAQQVVIQVCKPSALMTKRRRTAKPKEKAKQKLGLAFGAGQDVTGHFGSLSSDCVMRLGDCIIIVEGWAGSMHYGNECL